MNSELQKLVAVREYNPEVDKAFIMATFLRGLYYGDSWFSLMPKNNFMNAYKQVVSALIDRSGVYIACLKDDPNVILGYSIVSKDGSTLHWVFVKSIWRKNGVGKALLPKNLKCVTHLTALGKQLLPKFENCIFDPFNL